MPAPPKPSRVAVRAPRLLSALLGLMLLAAPAAAAPSPPPTDAAASAPRPGTGAGGGATGGATPGDPEAPSLLDASVDLLPGPGASGDTLLIKIPKPVAGVVPKVWETGPEGPTVEPGLPSVFGDPGAGEWLMRVAVKNLPQDSTQRRRLQITYGNKAANLEYTVRNTGAAFSWSVQGPPTPLAWTGPGALALTVSVGPKPATNLVARATLVDDRTNRPFAARPLQICSNADDKVCSVVTRLEPDRPQTVYLRPVGEPGPGKYIGAVQLLSSEAKADPLQLTVTVTNGRAKFWGGFVVVISVMASYVVTVLLRNGLARAELLRPALAIEEGFRTLAALLKPYLPELEGTAKQIDAWRAALTSAALEREGYLPNRWVTPPGAPSALYTAFLTKAGGCSLALERLIGLGASELRQEASPLSEEHREAVAAAWRALDDLSQLARPTIPEAPTLASIETEIDKVIDTLRQATRKAMHGQLTGDWRMRPPSAVERLSFEITVLGMASWAVSAFLTIVAGLLLLVVTRPEFGLVQDYLYCLLWGFGLPTTAAQLTQQTPQTVAAAVGVTRPAGG